MQRPGQGRSRQRVPHGALPMADRPGRDHLPKYILHKLVRIFFFAPNLTKYTVTIPCHFPVSWSSYFKGIALDLARGKQCYLRKAEFLLNLHLADTEPRNTNQNLTHLLHPSHVQLQCLGDPNKALTQRHPDLTRYSTTC